MKLLKIEIKKVNKKLNYSIFIGTSGSIIEALENGKSNTNYRGKHF